MDWDIFNIIGTIAFAMSGAIVAMEEEYDIFGVYILGLATAFGGGAVRNLLIGVPVSALWEQNDLFQIALITMTVLFFFPKVLKAPWERFGEVMDAIGLAAFAIQGALHAKAMGLPLSAMIVAAVLTGSGGGVIRDLLAQRKPVVLRDEIYAFWAILAAIGVYLGFTEKAWEVYTMSFMIVCLRLLSVYYHWHLPRRVWPKQ